nr:retrovirus-related Pol polyprotein from transposon TNT 1-94 [Tanacetum cinerariifolium]
MVPTAVLTQSKPIFNTAIRPVSAAMPKINVTRPRYANPVVTKSKSPIRRNITYSSSPKTSNLRPRVTAVQALVGNPQHALKDKGVIDSGCSRHITRNMSCLSDFEELNGGYVAFGDSLLPILFWSEAVNTACYVQNRVLVTKPHNKTPYELLHGRTPSISFMRPFGCPVTIFNTLESLEKIEGKVDEGFLVGYSVNSKAFRVFNSRNCIVQETLHVNFLENKPNVAGSGPTWLFDIDSLTRTMNYQPVIAGNQTNPTAGFQDKFNAEKAKEEVDQQYVLFPVWSSGSTNPQNYDGNVSFDGKEHDFDAKKPESEVNVSPSNNTQSRKQDDKTIKEAKGKSHVESFTGYRDLSAEFEDCSDNNSNEVNAAELEDITYSDDENDVGAEGDFNNLETSITEPKRVHQALKDPSWIAAMQEELLQFKMQKVWVLVDLPHGKRSIGFENPDHPDKVYKVVKALYGLHQAPRAW